MRHKAARSIVLGLLPRLDSRRLWRDSDVLWPDDTNRSTADIDALAANKWAIEHTSLDTLPNQRRNDAWFSYVIDGLEPELSNQIGCYLLVRFPYEPLTRRIDYEKTRKALRNWIRGEWLALPEGHVNVRNVPDVPFAFDVLKESGTAPALHFVRNKPEDHSLPTRLRDLLGRKAGKLHRYRRVQLTTVLLVENDNIALMGYGRFAETYANAFGSSPPAGVDLVWYVDTHPGTGPDYFLVSGDRGQVR